MISYLTDAESIGPHQLTGFFRGWPDGPTPETHARLLRGSDHVVLAFDEEVDRVVGFVTAITDGVLAAYVPLLEVLPEYERRGIAKELMRRIREALRGYYMIDLVCDSKLEPFYESLGYARLSGMALRDYERQRGRDPGTPGTTRA